MSHPMDEIVRQYHKKLDELQNVERQIKDVQPILERQRKLHAELAELRAKLANQAEVAAIPATEVEPLGE